MLSFTRLQSSLYEDIAFVYMFWCIAYRSLWKDLSFLHVFLFFDDFTIVTYSGYTSQAADTRTGSCLPFTNMFERERVSTDPIIRWVFFLLIHVYILLKCFKFFFRSWYFLNHYKTEKCCFYNNKSITHKDGLTELLLRLVIDWYRLRYDIWILLKEAKHQFLELQVQNLSNVWWFWY